jgi:cytochrome c
MTPRPSTPSPAAHRPWLRRLPIALAATAAGVVALATCRATPPAAPPAQSAPSLYTQQVEPIFRANCYHCHANGNHRGGLTLDTRAGILAGGDDGPILVAGHPEQSLLITLIRREHPEADPPPMPPKTKLSDADIATITHWIQAGALIPEKP